MSLQTFGGLCIVLCLFWGGNGLSAQNRFGNEWIRHEQPYLKITVNATGFYRISLADIRQAGLTVDNLSLLQLFHRGQEVALNLENDFITFYGEANNGAQDSLLYRPYKARPHPYQTLYGDVTAYFLTVGKTAGTRMERVTGLNSSGLIPENYHLEQQRQVFTTDYSFNNFPGPVPSLQQSFYEPGEGWTGKFIKADSLAIWKVQLKNWVKNQTQPQLRVLFNGRSDFFHDIVASVGKTSGTARAFDRKTYGGYSHQLVETTVSDADLNADGSFVFSLQAQVKDNFELYSLSYHEVVFPQGFDMAGQTNKYFWLVPNKVGRSLVNINNVPADAQVFDFTDSYRPKMLTSTTVGTTMTVIVPETQKARVLYVVTPEALKPLAMNMVKFEVIAPRNITYCVITHASLRESANAFANYRTSAAGGGFNTKVFDIQDIYDQFCYGEHHPASIRRWADFMLATGAKPFLFLVGRPYTFPDFLKNSPDDLVPSIGYPGSDILLTAGLNSERPDVPALPTGRLNVTRNDQVLGYLAKVQVFEGQPKSGLWRKNVMHLSGGMSVDEISYLSEILKSIFPLSQHQWIGNVKVSAVTKSAPVEIENVNVSAKINEGVSMMTFLGHSSPTYTDLNIGLASTAGNGLNNQPKYPFMYFNGCAVGNVFFRYNTLTTDWLLTPQKGAIAVLAHSYWSFSSSNNRFLQNLYGYMFNDRAVGVLPIGTIQQQVNRKLTSENLSEYDISNLHQMVLQGDPAVVIHPLTKPDYEIKNTNVFVQANNAANTIAKSETIQIGAILSNAGLYEADKKLSVRVKVQFDTKTTEQSFTVSNVAYQDTLLFSMKNEGKIQRIEVMADADKVIDELDENNNTAALDVDWARAANTTSFPANVVPDRLPPVLEVQVDGRIIKNNATVAQSPLVEITLRDENPLMASDSTHLEVFLKKCDKCAFERISYKNLSFKNAGNTVLTATYKPAKLGVGTYELLISGRDAARNYVGSPYRIAFVVLDKAEAPVFRSYPNPASGFGMFEAHIKAPTPPQQISLKITDLLGRTLYTHTQTAYVGENQLRWSSPVATGVYVGELRLLWADGTEEKYQQKIIIN